MKMPDIRLDLRVAVPFRVYGPPLGARRAGLRAVPVSFGNVR